MNLSQKTNNWVEHNIISASQRQEILEAEKIKQPPFLFLTLLWTAVLCLCLGIAAIMRAYWYQIPDSVKLTIVGVLIVGGLILSYLAVKKERHKLAETALFFTFLAIGGGIGLIAQIFNLPMDGATGLLLWAVLSLGIVLISKRKLLPFLWVPLFLGGIVGYMKLELLLLFFEQTPLFATTLLGGILICLIYLSHFFSDRMAQSLYHWSVILYFPVVFLGDLAMHNPFFGFLVSAAFLALLGFFAVMAKKMILFNVTVFFIVLRLLLLYFQSFSNPIGAGVGFSLTGIALLAGIGLFFYMRQNRLKAKKTG